MKKFFPLFMVAIGVVFCIAMSFLMQSIFYPVKYREEIISVAKKYDLAPSLVCAVINVESGFDKNAISKKGAMGLMQVMPKTAASLKIASENFEENDLLSEQTNLEYGCYYLNLLMHTFAFDEAICAYNAGPTKVKTWLKNEKYSSDGVTLKQAPYKETREYLAKVKKNLAHYKARI